MAYRLQSQITVDREKPKFTTDIKIERFGCDYSTCDTRERFLDSILFDMIVINLVIEPCSAFISAIGFFTLHSICFN